MKDFAILLATVVIAPGCSSPSKANGSAAMTCELAAFGSVMNGQRCENSEAVCYLTENGSGISCIKK